MEIVNFFIGFFYKYAYLKQQILIKITLKKAFFVAVFYLFLSIFLRKWIILFLILTIVIFVEVSYFLTLENYVRKVQKTQKFLLKEPNGAKRYYLDYLGNYSMKKVSYKNISKIERAVREMQKL